MSSVGGTVGTGRHARPKSMLISSKSNVMMGTWWGERGNNAEEEGGGKGHPHDGRKEGEAFIAKIMQEPQDKRDAYLYAFARGLISALLDITVQRRKYGKSSRRRQQPVGNRTLWSRSQGAGTNPKEMRVQL